MADWMTEGEGAWLLVGLGNPGPQYAGNRHNVGAMALDRFGARIGGRFGRHRCRADVLEGRVGGTGGLPGPRVVLAKPSSYMNESGGPVVCLTRFFKTPPERLLVVHDELDIGFGDLRLKRGGGEGGHNGLRSVSAALGTRDYCRLRIGIGRPPGRMDPADYVLRDFAPSTRVDVDLVLEEALDLMEAVVTAGFEATRRRVDVTPPADSRPAEGVP